MDKVIDNVIILKITPYFSRFSIPFKEPQILSNYNVEIEYVCPYCFAEYKVNLKQWKPIMKGKCICENHITLNIEDYYY